MQAGYGPRPGRTQPRPLSSARSAMLALLRSQRNPVRIETLVQASGLHHNTVREHLSALVHRGLATRDAARPAGRGRPAWLYQATAEDVAAAPEYAGLAAALAAMIARTSSSPARDAELAGSDWGHRLAVERDARPSTDGRTARRAVVDLLDELGFEPTADEDLHTVRLHSCPLLRAAVDYPEVVCAVHRGLAKGALTEYGQDASRTSLDPFAEPGACVLRMR